MRSTSSVRKSRTVRSIKSGSWNTQVAIGCFLIFSCTLVPFFEQQREVADEVAQLLAFAGGAHDHAHAVGNVQFAQDFFQALALLDVFNLAGDAALIRVGQQHEETSRQHEVGRDARAFGADRSFRDLHDDVRAGRIEPRNVLLRDLGRCGRRPWFSRSTISTPESN